MATDGHGLISLGADRHSFRQPELHGAAAAGHGARGLGRAVRAQLQLAALVQGRNRADQAGRRRRLRFRLEAAGRGADTDLGQLQPGLLPVHRFQRRRIPVGRERERGVAVEPGRLRLLRPQHGPAELSRRQQLADELGQLDQRAGRRDQLPDPDAGLQRQRSAAGVRAGDRRGGGQYERPGGLDRGRAGRSDLLWRPVADVHVDVQFRPDSAFGLDYQPYLLVVDGELDVHLRAGDLLHALRAALELRRRTC